MNQTTQPDERRNRYPNTHRVIDLERRGSPLAAIPPEPAATAIKAAATHPTPPDIPADPGIDADGAGQREAARQAYRESLAAGRPLTRGELAARFGYSRSWSRDRITEVRAETTPPPAARATAPDEQEDTLHENPDDESQQRPQPHADWHAHQARRTGRRVAWLAFIVGIAASVAANVMHAQIVSTNPAAWIGAAFWPVALLLAIEVLARVPWPRTSRRHRFARYAGTSMVATVAAILSYRHMAGLLNTWGEDTLSAYLGPLAVDGLMILAAAALLINGRSLEGRHAGERSQLAMCAKARAAANKKRHICGDR